jgi:Do/DeqQ family serine protease
MKKSIFSNGLVAFAAAAALAALNPGTAALGDEPVPADALTRTVPDGQSEVLLSFAPVVKEVAPAVVNIYTRKKVTVNASPFFNDPFFQRFFGNSLMGVPQERILSSLGSGVIVGPDGTVVTNNHVIGGADTIQVVLADRREFEAEVVLADARTDLAVLKLKANGETFPYLKFHDSDQVEVGDIALAIGNPFGLGQTVTSGIVSAVARSQAGINDFQFFLQTDAAVNMGNSGGALVSLDGRLIGINSNILSHSGDSAGIGFAIPSNMVRWVVDASREGGKLIRPWIGVSGQNVDNDTAKSLGLDRAGGVLVNSVFPGGPGEVAGIRPGDVILAVKDREVVDEAGLDFRIATTGAGQTVPFRVFRDGAMVNLAVAPGLPPETPPRQETKLEGDNPFAGVTVANLSPRLDDELGLDFTEAGVIVLEVDPASAAARRNFVRPGDIILNYNGAAIARVTDLKAALVGESGEYVYQLKRQDRVIACGIGQGGRSFYCREG